MLECAFVIQTEYKFTIYLTFSCHSSDLLSLSMKNLKSFSLLYLGISYIPVLKSSVFISFSFSQPSILPG